MEYLEILNGILEQERNQLDLILSEQKKIRKDVTERNWEKLEVHVQTLNILSHQFTELEKRREEAYEGAKEAADGKDVLLGNPLYHSVHQKLAASRVENDSLNKYISVTRDFIQGIFDNVVPKRRNTLYSANGKVVRAVPEALLLDALS